MPAYSQLEEVLQAGAAGVERELGAGGMFKDTLRPSRMRSWQSYFLDRPALGGEVTALAGYHGLTFATTADARAAWGTPDDLPGEVDAAFAARQSAVVCGIIGHLGRAPKLHEEESPRNGFSSVSGRAKFLRHGELFADKPAPGTVLLCYQGPARFHVMVDPQGRFNLKGVADKTHSFHKVILEGYRFDEESGNAVWAIDKKLTGKDAYRVKMNRRFMETDLVMFAGTGTTLFNLLEPRTFRYLSKPDVIDGRREADPLRWFMSRLDTWSSAISTVFLEPGTPLKLTLSDTPLRRKLVLLNASEKNPTGSGYEVEDFPRLYRTEYRVARDMWKLLRPRIANLEARGIFNERIRSLQSRGSPTCRRPRRALRPGSTTGFPRPAPVRGPWPRACTTTWTRPRRTSSTACCSTSRSSCRSLSASSGCCSPMPTSTSASPPSAASSCCSSPSSTTCTRPSAWPTARWW